MNLTPRQDPSARRASPLTLLRSLAANATLRFALTAALLVPAVPVHADETDLPDTNDLALNHHEVLPASPHPFRAGESLRFSVQYGFIKAGSAWLEVPEVTQWNGTPVWRLVARAESNSFFDKMYKVRNRIESFWDHDSLFSWRYFEDRHEGHFKANDTLWFDPSIRQVRYKNGQTYEVPPHVQDALSAFYYTRFQALPLGGSVVFDYHASRKSAPMEVRVLGRQTVKTPAGKFKCVVIEPLLKAGGIFKNKGRLVIWLTDDERRMPVLMKSKVLIGSISVVLQEAKPGA
ncbi:MAG: DUF3108 domain-containing protein [Candidatus Eisenbacteria bacterium]